MEKWLIGCGALTWPREMDRDQVWAEIMEAGYDGLPVSPDLGTPDEVLARCTQFALKPAPGHLAGDFWKPEEEEDILARAASYGAFTHTVGWIIAETDRTMKPTAFESAKISRGYLASLEL